MRRLVGIAWRALFLLAVCGAAAPADAAGERPVLAPGDRLQIRVVGEPELSKDYLIDEGGRFTIDLLGPVRASGLTPAELQAELTKELSRFLRKPAVTVHALQRVAVGGGVLTPGTYDFPKDQPLRVMDALTRAGGFSERARKSRVLLVRRIPGQTQPKTLLVNVDAYLKKGKADQNPALEPNDVVFVDVEEPRRGSRGIAGLLEKALPLLGTLF